MVSKVGLFVLFQNSSADRTMKEFSTESRPYSSYLAPAQATGLASQNTATGTERAAPPPPAWATALASLKF